MGRKRTPAVLKLLTGNPGRKPLPKDEPKVKPGLPKPPSHLCRDAKAEWAKISQELYAIGVLTKIDKAVLAAYCTSYALWARAWRAINLKTKVKGDNGLITETSTGYVAQNPLIGIANKAAVDMVKYASELGMTPASRSKVKAEPVDPDADNSEKYFS